MDKQIWITTLDNPFDPFSQFMDWFRFDEMKGYFTCERVAILARCSVNLSPAENDARLNNAILRLLELNPLGNYTMAIEGQTQRW